MSLRDLQTIEVLKRLKIYNITKGLLFLREKGIKRTLLRKKGADIPYHNIQNQKFINFELNTLYFVTDKKSRYDEIKKSTELKNFLSSEKLNLEVYLLVSRYKKDTSDYNEVNNFDFKNNFRYKAYIYYGTNTACTSETMNAICIKTIDEFIANSKTVDYLRLYSNYCNKNNVSVRTGTFLTVDGKNFYSGGAERYLLDLNEILRKKNINMNIYQNADIPFIRKYENIDIIGLPLLKEYKDGEEYNANRNISYIYEAKQTSQLYLYSAFFEAYPQALHPSVGISHGIAWDNISNHWVDGVHFDVDKNIFIKSADMCDKLVSVDTNTCNWFQTLDYNLGARKFNYIPNYVDINEFKPRDDYLEKKDKIIITYPRRLYAARGLYLMLNITEKLVKKYKNVEVHFVGKGFDEDLKNVDKVVKKYPKNVFCYSKTPNDMHSVYENTDISVIPTIMSEGTSLSCLEAMASGNIIVSTRIGGLSDLVINGYNGYLVEPNEEALYNALVDIIENYDEKIKIKKQAREVAKTFNKSIWKEKWNSIFDSFDLTPDNSSYLELIEYKFNKLSDIRNSSETIYNSLKENKLVYISVKEKIKDIEKMSSQRLQFISDIDETILPKHKIIDMTNNKKRRS